MTSVTAKSVTVKSVTVTLVTVTPAPVASLTVTVSAAIPSDGVLMPSFQPASAAGVGAVSPWRVIQ